MTIRLQIRKDLSSNWTSSNPILALGEPGLETNTNKLKFGDGVTAWNALAYFAGSGGATSTSGLSDWPATPDARYARASTTVQKQAVAAAVTVAAPLAVNTHTPVDASAGAISPMTLPTGQSGGSYVSVAKAGTDATSNAVTITGNIRGVGAQSISISLPKEGVLFLADAAGSWWPVADHKTLGSLDTHNDARYDAIGAAAAVSSVKSVLVDQFLTQSLGTITTADSGQTYHNVSISPNTGAIVVAQPASPTGRALACPINTSGTWTNAAYAAITLGKNPRQFVVDYLAAPGRAFIGCALIVTAATGSPTVGGGGLGFWLHMAVNPTGWVFTWVDTTPTFHTIALGAFNVPIPNPTTAAIYRFEIEFLDDGTMVFTPPTATNSPPVVITSPFISQLIGPTCIIEPSIKARTDTASGSSSSNVITDTAVTTRFDAGATGSAISPVISDVAILVTDYGGPVSGTNIPAGSYVGVIGNLNFTLVNASGQSVLPTGAVSGVTIGVDQGKAVSGTNIPPGAFVGPVTSGASFQLVNASGGAVNPTGPVTSVVLTQGDAQVVDWMVSTEISPVASSASTRGEVLRGSAMQAFTNYRAVSYTGVPLLLSYLHEDVTVDCTNGAVQLLPQAPVLGATFTVKKTDFSGNTVALIGNAGALLDGAASVLIAGPGQAVEYVGDGTNWRSIHNTNVPARNSFAGTTPLPTAAAAPTGAVTLVDGSVGLVDCTNGIRSVFLPAPTLGAVAKFKKIDPSTNYLTAFAIGSRTDTVSGSAGSSAITDTSILLSDAGRAAWGPTGIPVGAFIGSGAHAPVAGASLTLVDSTNTPLNLTANITSLSIGPGIQSEGGTVAAAILVPYRDRMITLVGDGTFWQYGDDQDIQRRSRPVAPANTGVLAVGSLNTFPASGAYANTLPVGLAGDTVDFLRTDATQYTWLIAAPGGSSIDGLASILIPAGAYVRLWCDQSALWHSTAKGGPAAVYSGAIIGIKQYAPVGLAAYNSTTTAGAALDTTNLTVSFVAPPSGSVLVSLEADCILTSGSLGWGVFDHTLGTLVGNWCTVTKINIGRGRYEQLLTGLTPGLAYQYDWAGANGTAAATVTTYAQATTSFAPASVGPALMKVTAV